VAKGLVFGWVLFDSWYLAPEFLTILDRLDKDWVSILKHNRNLETQNLRLRDVDGKLISFAGPHIQVEALVPQIPHNAYQSISIHGRIYYTFTMTVRIPSLGKVRLVISFDNPELQGNYVVLAWISHVENRIKRIKFASGPGRSGARTVRSSRSSEAVMR